MFGTRGARARCLSKGFQKAVRPVDTITTGVFCLSTSADRHSRNHCSKYLVFLRPVNQDGYIKAKHTPRTQCSKIRIKIVGTLKKKSWIELYCSAGEPEAVLWKWIKIAFFCFWFLFFNGLLCSVLHWFRKQYEQLNGWWALLRVCNFR